MPYASFCHIEKVKVFHGLVNIGAVITGPVYLGHSI